RWSAVDVDRDDVRKRVHAGVGTARHREIVRRAIQAVERNAQYVLDRALTGLSRPAAEAHAVVGNCQLQPHANPFDTQEQWWATSITFSCSVCSRRWSG